MQANGKKVGWSETENFAFERRLAICLATED